MIDAPPDPPDALLDPSDPPPDPSAAASSYRHRLIDPSRWEVTRRERWRMRARAGAAVASRGRFL